MGGFLAADGLVGLILVASLMSASGHGASGARTALIVGLAPAAERLDALASLRVLGHAGDALGAAAGALVIALDDPRRVHRADRRERREPSRLRARRRPAAARPARPAERHGPRPGALADGRTWRSRRSAAC